jgi:hypothetical protein
VALITSKGVRTLSLQLLDDVPDGELEEGSTVDLFVPRAEGVYHWLCIVSSPPRDQSAEVELLNEPLLIQRRVAHRVGAALQAEVRREHSSRRGRPHEALVVDLSHGGLKLETACQLSTGDTVEVTMFLSGTTAQVVGRVVMAYRGPDQPRIYQAHVSFLEDQRDTVELVDRFIAQQLSEAPPSLL